MNRTAKYIAIALLSGFVAGCGGASDYASSGARGSDLSALAERTLIENVGDRVFFSTDRSTLTATARDTLRQQADWLAANPKIRLRIEGHADERGTRDYNLALGARRAQAVRDYLVGRGISSLRLQTISFGKERPVALCSLERCWSKNRRAVSIVNN